MTQPSSLLPALQSEDELTRHPGSSCGFDPVGLGPLRQLLHRAPTTKKVGATPDRYP